MTARRSRTACPTIPTIALANGQNAKEGIPAQTNPEALTAAGYKAHFDGMTLKGRQKPGGTAQYKVAGGATVGFGRNLRGNTFLRTEKTYRDLYLVA